MMRAMFTLVIYFVLLNGYHLTEVILKQTNANSDIDITWSAEGSCTGAWIWENSKWTTCISKDQSCSLTSLFWNILDANLIFVNVSVSVTKCAVLNTRNPKPARCSDSIQMKAYISDGKSNSKKYDFVSNVPKGPVPKTTVPEFYITTDTYSIENVSGKIGINLQFYTSDFCGQLQKIAVFYHKCPSVTSALANFESKAAPNKQTGSISIDGQCAPNTVMKSQNRPVMTCNYDGSHSVQGECICKAGFTKDVTQCKECSLDEYKPSVGNQPCMKCGADSRATLDRISCNCIEKYFREYGKTDSSADCYRPPDPPENAKVIAATSDYITLSWQQPLDPGSKPLKTYIIKCEDCPEKFHFKTNKLSYNLTGLGSFANYTVNIYNENEITNLTKKMFSAVVKFQTPSGAPGPVRNVEFITNSDGSVLFKWDEPFALGGSDITYVFSYGGNTYRTKERTYTISTDTQDKSYTVQIYAEVTVNGKVYKGEPVTKESVSVKGGIPLALAIGVAFGAIAFVVIVLIVAFCIWRKRNPPYLQVVRMEDGTVKLPGRFYNAGKLYVDPTTYNAVDDAVEEFAYELDRKDLKFGPLLGGGEFAEVYKGELVKNAKRRDVAIKMLKQGASKRDRDDFLGEAAILGQFTDENVVSLEGVILKDRPNLIVLEFMSNGALDKYLQDNDNQFTILQLLGMARGVSSGMKYLSELGFIHRDLAARNILVNEFKVCKVSDFGMSREIKVDETYDTQGGKIPVRWTAPEAIQYKKFTTSSDVWSYGIMLWEIVSYGERPYWDWGNYDVLERINAGYRLPPPMGCPKVVHDLMLSCWAKDRVKRPKFTEIRDQLEKWIRNPDLLKEIASVITKTDENLDYTVLQTTHKWLEAIGMSRYTGNFIDQGFATPRQILDLTLEDLEALGVGPIGHRKKIYKAIQNTKAQVEARHNSVSGRRKTASVSKKQSN